MSAAIEEFPNGLRTWFRQHNRRAAAIALGSLIAAIACWGLVYFLSVWLRLLFLTVTEGVNAPNEILMPRHFLSVALTFLILGWGAGKLKTENHRFSWLTTILRVVSIPAHLTFSVSENFSARVHPSPDEMAACWILLEALRHERKIPTHAISALLDKEHKTERISYLLGIVGLTDTDNYGGNYYIHLRDDQARRRVRQWAGSLELNSRSTA